MSSRKKIKWGIALFLVVGLGIWISCRWSVWFGNPPEFPYETRPEPHRVLLTMGTNGPHSRIVTWQADTMAQEGKLMVYMLPEGRKEIAYIYEASCEVVETRGGKVAFYRAAFNLDNLCHSVNGYRFSVETAGKKSGIYEIGLPDSKDATSFIFMGDVQDTARGLSHNLFKAIDRQHADADFWLFGGDLVERPIDGYWQVAFDDLDTVASAKPVLAISGNHEYLKGLVKQLDPRFGQVFGYYQNSKVGDNHVFSFAYGGARFFLLDSNTDAWNLPAQRSWLEEQLQNCTEKWKIVVLHHPLHSNKGKHYNPMVKWAFGGLVKKYGVDLVLQAHEHVYARWNDKDEQGNYLAPLYLSTYCSPKQYQLHFSVSEDRIGTNDRFYQRITYNADSLSIWTYTATDHKPYDHVCITKSDSVGYRVDDFFKDVPQKVEISNWFKANKGRHLKEYEKEIEEWKNRHRE